MEVRRLLPEEKAQAKALWLEAFPEDEDGFGDYYFSERFPKDQYYGLFADGKLQSMAGVCQCEIRLLGKKVPAGFLRGVATSKSERGKGYSQKVIEYILRELKEQGIPIAALKTYIHPFYRRFGFEVCSHRCLHQRMVGGEAQEKILFYRCEDQVPEQILEQLCSCYQTYIEDKDFFMERDMDDFRAVLREQLDLNGGALFIHFDENRQMDGYLLGYEEGSTKTFHGEELVCIGGGSPQDFDAAVAQLGCGTLVYKAFDHQEQEDGMIRILDMAYFLQKAEEGCSAKTDSLLVQDPILEHNSGKWQLKGETPCRGGITPGQAAVLLMARGGRLAGIFEEY